MGTDGRTDAVALDGVTAVLDHARELVGRVLEVPRRMTDRDREVLGTGTNAASASAASDADAHSEIGVDTPSRKVRSAQEPDAGTRPPEPSRATNAFSSVPASRIAALAALSSEPPSTTTSAAARAQRPTP